MTDMALEFSLLHMEHAENKNHDHNCIPDQDPNIYIAHP